MLPEAIRRFLDLSYTPSWGQILHECVFPLLFMLACVAAVGGGI